jgi:TolA-binding protein
MVRWCRILFLMMLLGGGSPLWAANSADAFRQASKTFQNGFWDQAAVGFASFVTNFPDAPQIPEAILLQGEAVIKDRHFDSAIELLSSNLNRAGQLGDLYLFWIAQANLGRSNYLAAAEAFDRLAQNFPASTNRLEALVGEAAAYTKLENWNRVVDVLGSANGPFQKIAGTVTNELVIRGHLLLGEAQLARKNFAAARDAVQALGVLNLKSELDWRRWYLQCRIELGEGDLLSALNNTTNLTSLATAAASRRLEAETWILRGNILEQLNLLGDAIDAYGKNVAPMVPLPLQQTSLMKIAELSIRLGQFDEAVQRLEKYSNDYPESAAGDVILLALGELKLKQAISKGNGSTNLLPQAVARFDALRTRYPNSAFVGKALLGKGWCLWSETNYAQAEESFREAAERLPFSEDQAVARFKLADSQFRLGKLNDAIANYSQLATAYVSVPVVKESLLEQALYQTVRAAIMATNLSVASDAMRKILDWYPNGAAGDHSLLLIAQGYSKNEDPAQARKLLSDFEQSFPDSSLAPQVRLALARTYEKEGNWDAAITNYENWIGTFTNQPTELPGVLFARAWDASKAGQETNALDLFLTFVTQYPTNELTARAKWWIGDYYFTHKKWGKAIEYYPFTKDFAGSELYFPAQMMAGRAAMASLSYKDAISYFTNMVAAPSCPADLKVQAALAAGDAYMSRTEAGATNGHSADLQEAARWFSFIPRSFPGSSRVNYAWARLGDCYRGLGSFEEAADAYRKIISATNSSVSAIREAKLRLGSLAEKQAENLTGPARQAQLREALNHYVDAFTFEQNSREADRRDSFWIQQAGMSAAKAAENLGLWQQAINVYRSLLERGDVPAGLQPLLQKKIQNARAGLTATAKD